MPIMKKINQKPEWVKWSALGIFTCNDARDFDRHYHDADEYWLIFEGKAIILSEGIEYEVGPGDIVCTKMGDEHDFLKVIEPVKAFYIEDELRGEKRKGHLHQPDWQIRKTEDLKMIESNSRWG